MVNKKTSPYDTTQQATLIREAWSNIGTDATYGDITLAEFTTNLEDMVKTETQLKNLEDQTVSVRNQIVEQRYKLWNLIKRARNGAKAKHGDDSNEYERFGGTRISEIARNRKTNNSKKAPKASGEN